MTLDQYRDLADRLLRPFVAVAVRVGAGPDLISVVAFVAALAAGVSFGLATDHRLWYLLGAGLVLANGWLDILDGAVAREIGHDSAAGDLLDHVLDRYADVAIIVGLAAGLNRYVLGIAAVTGVLLTSYLGTQAQAVGLDRVYAGVLGRADRLALVGAVTAVAPWISAVRGVDPVAALLVVFAVIGHLTALQRFLGAWRSLG
ncbi:MAG: CDP-alcohol phosphatidyltransferase family protein [Halobacteriaceae archaeon]